MGYSIRTVCRDESMPSIETLFRWLRTKEYFNEQYTRAKQEAADAMADEILDIADDGTNDWMEDQYMKGRSPGWKVNGEAVQRSKLRVDSRIWLASKMKPKKYGAKLDVEATGEIVHKFEDLTDEELDRAIKARQDRLS
jgi:hypothetical protein